MAGSGGLHFPQRRKAAVQVLEARRIGFVLA
ncbi:MAG: hypothetical protein KIC91_06665 [Sutterella sp.]|nr:hypothetical protein [Sutterella sp.]